MEALPPSRGPWVGRRATRTQTRRRRKPPGTRENRSKSSAACSPSGQSQTGAIGRCSYEATPRPPKRGKPDEDPKGHRRTGSPSTADTTSTYCPPGLWPKSVSVECIGTDDTDTPIGKVTDEGLRNTRGRNGQKSSPLSPNPQERKSSPPANRKDGGDGVGRGGEGPYDGQIGNPKYGNPAGRGPIGWGCDLSPTTNHRAPQSTTHRPHHNPHKYLQYCQILRGRRSTTRRGEKQLHP